MTVPAKGDGVNGPAPAGRILASRKPLIYDNSDYVRKPTRTATPDRDRSGRAKNALADKEGVDRLGSIGDGPGLASAASRDGTNEGTAKSRPSTSWKEDEDECHDDRDYGHDDPSEAEDVRSEPEVEPKKKRTEPSLRSAGKNRPVHQDEDDEAPSGHGKRSKIVVDDGLLRGREDTTDEFVESTFQSRSNDDQISFRVLEWVVRLVRTKAELLVMSQFVYWFGVAKGGKLRAKVNRDGYWWVIKTYKKLARETSLTPGQVRAAIRKLKALGLLITDDDVGAGHLVRYRLSLSKIREQTEACAVAGQEDENDS